MTTNWQSLRSTFKTIGLLIGTFWRRLTEPDETVPEPERRRQARLLAGMLVTIIPVGIWVYFSTLSSVLAVLDSTTAFRERPILSIVPIALVIFGVAYGLSRGKYYVWGALIFLVNLYVADFMVVANAATPAAVVGTLSYLSLCILIGSLFLPLWGTIVLHIACLLGIYLLPVFSVPAAVAYPDSIAPAFNTILVIGTLIVVTAAMRQQDLRQIRQQAQELETTQEKVIQQERLAVVGQLAVGIAHEFNNILAATALYTEMSLREPELPSKIRKRLNLITQQTRHATDLVQQIADFGQRAVLDRKTVDVAALLEETVALLERTLPQNIQIELTRECTTPVTINGDPKRVRQAVVNLALNARDAMPEGGQLRIELERVWIEKGKEPPLPEMPVGEWIQVTVTDTGPGIPPDVLPYIYEPFFTTRAPLGHGLGLAQVYGIVRQHNGYIDVETRTGEGTTFTIYLPAESLSPPKTPPPATPALDQGKGETVLVVEDDVALRGALVDCLQMFNYQTLEASSGREALTILKERKDVPLPDSGHSISLVLSNWMMPGMSGLELAWELEQHYPDVKALILTDHPLDRPSKDMMPDNIVDWLQRPVDLERLAQLLRDILSEK